MAKLQEKVIHPVGMLGAFKFGLYATELAPQEGLPCPPALKRPIDLIYIDNPADFGLPNRHPVEDIYRDIEVRYFVAVVRKEDEVQRGPVKGVPYTIDTNGTHGIFACVTSEFGRNRIAPTSWKANSDTPDPTARPCLEYVRVEEEGRSYMWQNFSVHGWGGWNNGYGASQWFDGSPINVRDMHNFKVGQVRQSVLVSADMRGIGLAEQSIGQDALRQTISVLVHPLTKEAHGNISGNPAFNQLMKASESDKHIANSVSNRQLQAKVHGMTKPEMTTGFRGTPSSGQAPSQFKAAAASAIQQTQPQNPFGLSMYADPDVLIVILPIHEDQLNQFFPELGNNAPQDGIIGF